MVFLSLPRKPCHFFEAAQSWHAVDMSTISCSLQCRPQLNEAGRSRLNRCASSMVLFCYNVSVIQICPPLHQNEPIFQSTAVRLQPIGALGGAGVPVAITAGHRPRTSPGLQPLTATRRTISTRSACPLTHLTCCTRSTLAAFCH